MCNSVSSYSDRTDVAGPTGNRPRGYPPLSADELSGWDRARRRVRIHTRIAIRCTARGGRIAVAMAVSRDSRVIPARYPRVVVPTPVLDEESSERILQWRYSRRSVPSGFSGHVATAMPPPRLPKRAIITNEKLLK